MYLLDSDLLSGWCYTTSELPGAGFFFWGGGQGFSRLVGRREGKGINVYCI